MGRPRRLDGISKTPRARVAGEQKPKGSELKNNLSSLPAELHLAIVRHLPRMSLPPICRLNRHWRRVSTDELLRRLLPIPLRDDRLTGEDLLKRAIRHFIDTNNADALQRLLDFRPTHPYFPRITMYPGPAEPVSLRARLTKDEEKWFWRCSDWSFTDWAVEAAFKFRDMSCMQQLIDHGLVVYARLLSKAVSLIFGVHQPGFARPCPWADSRGGHNSVLNWLLAYPPRHVVQALLIM